MKSNYKAIIKRKQTVHMYSELWHASKVVLEKGCSDPKGSSWQFLSSIILTAFSFEAYMNHVGEQILASWDGLQRLSPLSKLDIICEILKVGPLAKDKRPRQTLDRLFGFRNTLAHGKTRTVTAKPVLIIPEYVDEYFKRRLLADWQQLVNNDKFAKQVREDVEKIVKKIHEKRPEPKEYPFSFGMGIGSATLE